MCFKIVIGRSADAADDGEPGFGAAGGEAQVGGEGIDFETRGLDGLDVPARGKGGANFIPRDTARAVAGGFGVAEAEEEEMAVRVKDVGEAADVATAIFI